jgi:hypothetical protein
MKTINYAQSTLERRASLFFFDPPCTMLVYLRGVNLNPLYVLNYMFPAYDVDRLISIIDFVMQDTIAS